MVGGAPDPATEAFVRMLRDGSGDAQAKSEALRAMLQRSMWVATWEPRAEGFRTLVNSSGEEALAVFSSEEQLSDAAARFGWLGPDGSIGKKSLGGKVLLTHAVDRNLAFLVIDIAAEHALEFTREEFVAANTGGWEASPPPARKSTPARRSRPPRKSDPARRSDPSHKSESPSTDIKEIGGSAPPVGPGGTYGAASIIPPKPASKSVAPPSMVDPRVIEAQPPAEPPPPAPPVPDPPIPSRPLPDPPPTRTAPPSITPPKPARPPQFTESSQPSDDADPVAPTAPHSIPPLPRVGSLPAPGIEFAPMGDEPDAEMLRDLANVLRNFPEVEWAAYCEIRRAIGDPSPAIGLRLDPNYRENVTMMIRQLCEAGREHGVELDAVLIDQPQMMRQARASALVFFPWRPKSLLPGG